MHAAATSVTTGPVVATEVNVNESVTLTSDPAATSHEQLWMISGSAWRENTSGLWSAVVTISGDGQSASATWQMPMTRPTCHYALPMLMIHTQFPPGTYAVSSVASDPANVWDQNDQCQIAVVEMAHTGIGGGA